MNEKELADEIMRLRRDAIEHSDKKLIVKIGSSMKKSNLLAVAVAYLLFAAGFATFMGYQLRSLQPVTETTFINNTHTIQESVGNMSWTQYNKTVVEHVIRGELTMTCVSTPNSSWVSCYREVKR